MCGSAGTGGRLEDFPPQPSITMKNLETLCTIKDACFTEKAGRTTIYKRIKEGHYKAFKIGGSTRLTLSSIQAYRKVVESQSQAALTQMTSGATSSMSVATDNRT